MENQQIENNQKLQRQQNAQKILTGMAKVKLFIPGGAVASAVSQLRAKNGK